MAKSTPGPEDPDRPPTQPEPSEQTHHPADTEDQATKPGGKRLATLPDIIRHHPTVLEQQQKRAQDLQLRIADWITAFAGSMNFVYLHAAAFALWMLVLERSPWPTLTLIVSLEAIFLSIFVLMTQSRESRIGELREELTLQVNLRMEEEITKTLHLVAGLYARLNLQLADDPELRSMLEPLDPKKMENDLTEQIAASMPEFKLRKRKDSSTTVA
jgi:uncharacterized membrane protein